MVTRITASKSLRNILAYNENKLEKKDAELIHAVGFAKDADALTFQDKLRTFQKYTSLNERTKVNSVHISLNFSPEERLSREKLIQLADTYMGKIGFGNQPFLVYQHHDADHPHIHIVTTNIRSSGQRIELHNIGKEQSEKARKELEIAFNLVKASDHERRQAYVTKPLNATKVLAGKHPQSGLKRAITNVLDYVLPTYRYGSLTELNAVLRQYNIVADRGSEDSRTYKKSGLVYRALNEKGEKIGAPIPASHIYSKPTLKFLTARFAENEPKKQQHKQRVRIALYFAFRNGSNATLHAFSRALLKEKIQIVPRINAAGLLYGITYIDHAGKCVFNGSDLDKEYSANAIRERFRVTADTTEVRQEKPGEKQKTVAGPLTPQHHVAVSDKGQANAAVLSLPGTLIPTVTGNTTVTPELLTNPPKKRKKKLRH